MKSFRNLAMATALSASLCALTALAGDHHHPAPPPCEPGYRIVEEVVYQEVTRKVCRQVEEKKKKTVYSCKSQDFCVPDGPGRCPRPCGHHHRVDACPSCQAAGATIRSKCVLIKKQVDDTPVKKWVVEEIKEVVPVTVYRKVPCTVPALIPAPGVPGAAVMPDQPAVLPVVPPTPDSASKPALPSAPPPSAPIRSAQ